MARLPLIKRILREDLPDAPNWVERILLPINQFFEGVYNAFDRNITFTDNIAAQVHSFDFTTSSAYDGTAANFETIEFARTLNFKPVGLLLLQIIEDADNHTPIEGSPYIDWLDINSTIEIYLIRGLKASTKYTARVMLI